MHNKFHSGLSSWCNTELIYDVKVCVESVCLRVSLHYVPSSGPDVQYDIHGKINIKVKEKRPQRLPLLVGLAECPCCSTSKSAGVVADGIVPAVISDNGARCCAGYHSS